MQISRQHLPFLVRGLENQGFARLGVRFYARFMPEVKCELWHGLRNVEVEKYERKENRKGQNN